MSIKGKLEAIIYAAEEPVSVDHLASLLKETGLIAELLAPPVAEDGAEISFATQNSPEAVQTPVPKDPKVEKAEIKAKLRTLLDEMITECASDDRGIELRQVAGGYRYSTKPEHHDVV